MAVSEAALPLQERVPVKNNNIRRASQLVILFLLVALLCCRLSSVLRGHGGVSWRAAFLCELWFTFIWLLNMNAKWNPVKYVTYPDRISKRFDDLPAVDMFVTTADPKLEPPLVTVNTVLSLLAVEYPAHKLACYVSDDGCSAVTYYALVEAAEFARSWVPFCKKYHVGVRAPFMYFSGEPEDAAHLPPSNFRRDWQVVKNKYEELVRRIDEESRAPSECLKGEGAHLAKLERGNHPSIVKVLWENSDGLAEGIPHLIYVSREKRPKHPHHYKAGALNVLYKGMGSNGLGCPNYSGTGCFHRRKVIYGEAPELEGEEAVHEAKGTPSPQELERRFGSSREMQESAAWIISASGSTSGTTPAMVKGLTVKQEAANQVASCTYEFGTCWGREVSEPAFAIPALLFASYSVYTLAEYHACGRSVRAWWNNQRMQRVQWTSPSLFGLLSVVAKLLGGLSETTFELTPKDQNASSYARRPEAATLQNLGRLTFDSSPMFVPGTALVFLNSAGAAAILLKLLGSSGAGVVQYGDVVGPGIAELACSVMVVMSFWPFVRGLFGKGSYGLPWSTILKGFVLSYVFFVFCKWSS